MNKSDTVEIVEDLNPAIKKGTRGTVVDILGSGRLLEIEFFDYLGNVIEYEGQAAFLVPINIVKLVS